MLQETKKTPPPKPVTSTDYLSNVALSIEGLRVASQVRLAHFGRSGREDKDTEEVLSRLKPLEKYVDDALKRKVLEHPTAVWWTRISGFSREIMGKIIGQIEGFGTWYEEGELLIPHHVKRELVLTEDGTRWVWVEGIERLERISKLWKFAGLAPEQRRKSGQKLDYNSDLKSCLWRLCIYSMLMQKNRYFDRYTAYKSTKQGQLIDSGVRILPTPTGRLCPECLIDVVAKATFFCPQCGSKLTRKEEPEGVVWVGHLDAMAKRWMIKLFLSHLWLVWRKAVNLPISAPYPIEKLGHTTIIDPYEMCDKGG